MVSLDVCLKIALVGNPFFTAFKGTDKGFFPSVSPHVAFKFRSLYKSPFAALEIALVRFLAGVVSPDVVG